MQGRHLFECQMQVRALDEFDDLKPIKKLVDWKAFRRPFKEIFTGILLNFSENSIITAETVN